MRHARCSIWSRNSRENGKTETMILSRSIIVFCCLIAINGCLDTALHTTARNSSEPIYVIAPLSKDTVHIMPTTKYFYRYVLPDFRDRKVTIQWVFSNLDHFGIRINEAWYYPGANETDWGNGAHGATIVHPSFIVGLTEQNSEVERHHFEPIEHFDPLLHPNGPRSRFTHYIPIRQTK